MIKRNNPTADQNQSILGTGVNQPVGRLSDDFSAIPIVPEQGQKEKIGDDICKLAQSYGAECNRTEFASSLRDRVLATDRYLGYISAIYPVVVGFNRGLLASMPKVDHVRESRFLKALARQLQEEQYHNGLWRSMLNAYSIDHAALYRELEEYMARFAAAELDQMTEGVLQVLRTDLQSVSPGIFPDPIFPEPVLALYHHMWMTGSYDDISFWEHYAGQYSMEVMIFDFVTTSFYPGIVGNSVLDHGLKTTEWWGEHARQGAEPGHKSSEERHLELAKHTLNRNQSANQIGSQVCMRAEDTMRLFAATMIFHNLEIGSFPIDRFRCC